MDKIKHLENKKLLKELEFVETEKNEVILFDSSELRDNSFLKLNSHEALCGSSKDGCNNLIYKGSRWLFVEHNQNPNIVNNIKETVSSNQPENNYILKVNLDQTEIVECFRGITEIRSKYKIGNQKIYSIIDNKTVFDNAYFMKITECPEDLLKNFELPIKWSKKARSIKSTNINNNKSNETIKRSRNRFIPPLLHSNIQNSSVTIT
jgi:hypothetical protein